MVLLTRLLGKGHVIVSLVAYEQTFWGLLLVVYQGMPRAFFFSLAKNEKEQFLVDASPNPLFFFLYRLVKLRCLQKKKTNKKKKEKTIKHHREPRPMPISKEAIDSRSATQNSLDVPAPTTRQPTKVTTRRGERPSALVETTSGAM